MSFNPLRKIKEVFSNLTDRKPITLGLDPAQAPAETKPAVAATPPKVS